MKDLKPRSCGGEAKIIEQPIECYGFSIACNKCSKSTGMFSSPPIEQWNMIQSIADWKPIETSCSCLSHPRYYNIIDIT